jgi:hypothetical protein
VCRSQQLLRVCGAAPAEEQQSEPELRVTRSPIIAAPLECTGSGSQTSLRRGMPSPPQQLLDVGHRLCHPGIGCRRAYSVQRAPFGGIHDVSLLCRLSLHDDTALTPMKLTDPQDAERNLPGQVASIENHDGTMSERRADIVRVRVVSEQCNVARHKSLWAKHTRVGECVDLQNSR